jgi:hypothetical protein
MAHRLVSPIHTGPTPGLTLRVSRERRLLPLVGMLLAVCGLLSLGAGLPPPTGPTPFAPIPEGQPFAADRVHAPLAAVMPVRFAWRRPQGSDALVRPERTAAGIAVDGSARAAERFPGRWIGRPARTVFADSDLRLVLRGMAHSTRSHPEGAGSCPCPAVSGKRAR